MALVAILLVPVLAGFGAAWVDRVVGRRIGWLLLVLAGGYFGWTAAPTEAGRYQIFIAGAAVAVALVVYGIAGYFRRTKVK